MNIITNPVSQKIFVNFESVNNRFKNIDFSVGNFNPKEQKTNVPVLFSSIAGVLASLLLIRAYKGKSLKKDLVKLSASYDIKTNLIAIKKNVVSFFNINAELKEMLLLGGGSILGGLTGGLIIDKDKTTKNKNNKIKEGVYQFANLAIPASLVNGLMKFTKKNEKLNKNRFAEIGLAIAGLSIGMPLSSFICNKINSCAVVKDDKYKRPMKLKDTIIHVDDIIVALIAAEVPMVSKLGLDKIFPLLSIPAGYETGKKN